MPGGESDAIGRAERSLDVAVIQRAAARHRCAMGRNQSQQNGNHDRHYGNIHRAVLQLFLRHKFMTEVEAIDLVKVIFLTPLG